LPVVGPKSALFAAFHPMLVQFGSMMAHLKHSNEPVATTDSALVDGSTMVPTQQNMAPECRKVFMTDQSRTSFWAMRPLSRFLTFYQDMSEEKHYLAQERRFQVLSSGAIRGSSRLWG